MIRNGTVLPYLLSFILGFTLCAAINVLIGELEHEPPVVAHSPIVFDKEYPAIVTRVIDGDTIDVSIELGFDILARKRIRIAGVDTPELPTVEGKMAASAVRSWILEKQVMLRTDGDRIDKYGRQLGDVFVDGFSVAERLLAEGYAVPYDK